MKYTRIYADKEGISHFADVQVELKLVDFAPPAPPVFTSTFIPAAQFAFSAIPVGWYGKWHPAPHRQFVCILSGKLEMQTGDGELRQFESGNVVLMEDTRGKGHVTRSLSKKDVLSVAVQLQE